MPTCTSNGCNKPSKARNLCSTHYNQQLPNRHPKQAIECAACGTTVRKERNTRRAQVCSLECRRRLQFGWAEPLPLDHWARWYGATCKWRPPPRPAPARFTTGRCADCDDWFTAETYGSPITYCSDRCLARVGRRIRRAREHAAEGTFRWAELIRLHLLFDRRCAYCDKPIDGQPDPEHVIPLSRGGRNDIGNLLPACRPCNADKRDLLLAEWAADRQRRGLPPVRVAFPFTDPRYRHLRLPADA